MDSCQSTTKRSFDMMELQNEEDNVAGTSKETEDGAKKTKQLKQELEPLKIPNVMELQIQEDNMAGTSEETDDCAKKTKQLVPELDPLKIPNILEIVFSYLDADSIKSARQVNKMWNVEGAKSLMNKCYIKIPKDLTVQDLDSTKMNKFKAFLSLKSSDRSMIPNITIATTADFDNWKLLGVLGTQVKAVKLKRIDDAKLVLKLLDVLPNLKYLNLQALKDSHKTKYVINSLISKVKKDGTELIVSSVTLEVDDVAKLVEFSNFTNIKVEELDLRSKSYVAKYNRNKVQIVNIINKLLVTNEKILKSLSLSDCQHFLPLLEFPSMIAVTSIYLHLWPETPVQISCCKFPPSFRFSENLPNLQEILLDYSARVFLSQNVNFLQQLVENSGPAPSVKRVKRFRDFAEAEVKFLFQLFPNLEELQTRAFSQYPVKWYTSLWSGGTKLRKLHLYFDFRQLNRNFDLDSIFTGFTPETVNKIKDDPNLEPYSLEKLEELRVNLSVLNLQELEHIEIGFNFNSRHDLPKRMLAVAQKYAFLLLPKNPEITINLRKSTFPQFNEDVEEALEEFSQFSNVNVRYVRYV